MNKTPAAVVRALSLCCAIFAASVFAQSNSPPGSDSGCVKTRCSVPTCFRDYAGGWYLRCPDGNHHLPMGEESPKPAQTPQVSEVTAVPPAVPLKDIAGDWEFRAGFGTSSKAMAALHLRLGPDGKLTGTLETLVPSPQLVKLDDVQVSGKVITYKPVNGNLKQGTISDDGQSIQGEQGSPPWQRVRTLPQALADGAKK